MIKRSLSLFAVFALAACGRPERVAVVKPPVALTECAAAPLAPDLPPVDWASVETARPVQRERDEATLFYILGLRSAWGDCASKVAGIKAWSDGLE